LTPLAVVSAYVSRGILRTFFALDVLHRVIVDRDLMKTIMPAALLLVLISCTSDPTNPRTALQIIKPDLGDRFFMDQWITDSSGNEVGGSRRSVVDSVTGVNASFTGRDSLVRLLANRHDLFISYQRDGDIAIPWYLTNDTAEVPRWLILPAQTATTVSLPAVVENDGTVVTTHKVTAQYVGPDSATINGTVLSASKVRITQTTDDQSGGIKITSINVVDFSFCADIGYFLAIEEIFTDRGVKAGGLRRILTGY